MPALAHAQLAGAAAEPQPLDGPGNLRLAPQLEERPVRPGNQPATFLLGDKTTGTTDEDMSAKGSAEVRRNVSVIKSDALHYDQDTDMADAYGNVRIISNGNTFVGPEAHMSVEANEGYMTNPKYRFNLSGGSGSAERVDLLNNEQARVDHGTYTACSCESDPAWYIKGTSFDFDTGADEGIAHNGVLFFQGVPIVASPWLSFPLYGRPAQRPLAADLLAQFDDRFRSDRSVLLQHRAEPRPDGDAAFDDPARRADGGNLPVSVAHLLGLDHG